MGLDRDLLFSWGHQEHRYYDDDNKEDDDEVEDNDKDDDNNNKDDNNDKGISALGLDRDLGFLRGNQTKPNHTNSYQTKPNQGYLSSGTR